MTMTPLADESALEPPPQCCDDEVHPRLREIEFFTRLDSALIGRCPADPSTVHIAPKRRAA